MKWIVRIAAGLAAVLLIAIAALLVMSRRADAGISASTIEINATPEHVWQWLEDPDKFRQWVGWVTQVDFPNPEVTGVGRRSIVTMKEPSSAELVKVSTVTTRYDPPYDFAADIELPGTFTGSQTYHLTAISPTVTRVEVTNRIRYTPWFGSLIEPLATPTATEKLKQDLANLKPLAEK